MKKALWSQTYDVSTFFVTPQKKLGLYGLLNIVQDIAWNHATHLGHGYEEMIREKTGWVLTRQKLRMERWPQWMETIEVKTWIRPLKGLLAIRDFEFFHHGEKVGECTTHWLILDLETRKPADKSLSLASDEVREDAPSIIEASKISLQKDLKEFARFHVRNSDLDLNGHVNNTQYAQWILDSISETSLSAIILEEYGVNFLSETRPGDCVVIQGGAVAEDRIQFQGVRSSDQKTLFAATLKVRAGQFLPAYNTF